MIAISVCFWLLIAASAIGGFGLLYVVTIAVIDDTRIAL